MSKEVANNKIQANSLADNKIQAKPEVGDVYLHEFGGIKLLVLEKSYKERGVNWWRCLREDLESPKLGYFTQIISETCLKKHHTYLGKAKFMPEDLFKTENE